MTTAEKLAQVRTAINAIETGGQAYASDGRSLSRGDLRTLYEQERRLEAIVARESRGGAVSYPIPVSG